MTARTRARAAAATLLLAVLSACVQGSYSGQSVDEPFLAEQVAALQPGTATLASCLHVLGAPNHVYEYRLEADGTSGMALLWHWRDETGWGLEVSGSDDVPGSVSYDTVATNLPGCMLWFRSDLVLERWRAGPIGELLGGRRRPTPRVDD